MRPRSQAPSHTEAYRRTANGVHLETGGEEAFRPALGPPLAALPFESAYRRLSMGEEERQRSERRIALWDRATQTALEVRDGSPLHERPAHLLAALLERVGQVRGKPIRCLGTMTLYLLGDDGQPKRTMQPDQCIYLHPERCGVFGRRRMVVGEQEYPDVVVEVDNTTDVRRHKLLLYEAWGFPELWVEVPDLSPRPAKTHGLTIYVRKAGKFREVSQSRAFPTWTAADIHAALNEARLSERTNAILAGVGAALGKREGTGPDDDPLLRSQRHAGREDGFEKGRQAGFEKGHRAGFEEGLDTGRDEGREDALAEAHAEELQRRAATVRAIMARRGLPTTPDFPLDVPGLADDDAFAKPNVEDVVDAAMRCDDGEDFVGLLRRAGRNGRK